ncbi:hypothetical protein F11_00905 [Rhodospirillum rubrum F11]|nr:hypothetical protein F11_00905 [Rhodospirillum rubrum F11]
MKTLATLVRETLGEQAVRDRNLGWGARLSDYADDLATLPATTVPVLVELDLDAPLPPRALVIDHHGAAAGENQPTALEQAFHLLALPAERWTRWHALVAANDKGHIAALRAMGATPEEIDRVREADRLAQGISPAEEAAGRDALSRAERPFDDLLLVHLPHNRTAVVMDRLPPGSPANVLILSPEETNFYGAAPLIQALNHAIPGGWFGGALPSQGFWGYPAPLDATRIFAALGKTNHERFAKGDPPL